MPGGAWSKGTSLDSGAWGAWSVATASMVPSHRPATTAATSSSVRSGGLTLKTGSYPATAAWVRSMWCGAASAVTARPSALARRTSSTEPAVERCRKWIGAPVRRASVMSRATIASSAAAGMPGMPSRLDQLPSCMAPPAARQASSQCCASVTPSPLA